MSPPALPDEDDLPPPREDSPPGVLVWAIGGLGLVLVFIGFLALLRPIA